MGIQGSVFPKKNIPLYTEVLIILFCMDEQINILRCLIANRCFASSHSALAKELGYKGKMAVYRLMEGKAAGRTVDEIWKRIQDRYLVSDITLCNLARIFEGAKYMIGKLLPEMNRKHSEWVENLILAFVNDDYDCFSPEFQEEEVPFLKDLRKDEPDIFWGLVTMLYIRCKKIDFYQGNPKLNLCQLVEAFDHLLFALYPERLDAHETSFNLKKMEVDPILYQVIVNSIILFRRYTEADFTENASRSMMLFNWGKRSFWRKPDSGYGQGSEIWLFVEQNFGRATNGYYMVLRLEAGKDIQTFELQDSLMFCFWSIDDENDPLILQAGRRSGTKREWCFYSYEYESEERQFSFEANPETGNLFGLPDTLRMINLDRPADKDEKVWARILKRWDESQGCTVFQKAKEMLSERRELKDEYKLEDVQISRNKFILVIDRQGKVIQYELPIEAYDFLSEITPSQRILIVRHTDDHAIYVEWPDLGYGIRLAEFAIVE